MLPLFVVGLLVHVVLREPCADDRLGTLHLLCLRVRVSHLKSGKQASYREAEDVGLEYNIMVPIFFFVNSISYSLADNL